MSGLFERIRRFFSSPHDTAAHDMTEAPTAQPSAPTSRVRAAVVDAHCPYCNFEFNPPPSRKKKCPECGNHVYVRTDPSDRKRYLVTEEQAKVIDNEWAQVSEPSLRERDRQWADFNKQLQAAMKQSHWQAMSGIYFEMASRLYEEGRDHFQLAQESRKCALRSYQDSRVVRKVEVLTTGNQSCDNCKKLRGMHLTIEQALEEMPIPVKSCTTWKDEGKGSGWCRCSYVSVVE